MYESQGERGDARSSYSRLKLVSWCLLYLGCGCFWPMFGSAFSTGDLGSWADALDLDSGSLVLLIHKQYIDAALLCIHYNTGVGQ